MRAFSFVEDAAVNLAEFALTGAVFEIYAGTKAEISREQKVRSVKRTRYHPKG